MHTPRSTPRRIFALLAAFVSLALLATACSNSSDGAGGADGPGGGAGDPTGQPDGSGGGETSESATQGVTVSIDGPAGTNAETDIIITLDDDTSSGDDAVARETTVDGDTLDDTATATLLDRLPELETDDADQVDFRRPPETRPRPRPGNTIDQSFPPADDDQPPAETETGPLEVVRFQPEGPVDLAPFISVTFNQPMVALSTVDQVEAADVPITITPEMPGRWIWLGARTVRFEYERDAIDRIPAATNYTVEVPAGTTSANGGELAEGLRFEFSTPTPQVEVVEPMHDALSTEPIFFVRFDQRVDPDSVLATTTLSAGGQDVALRLATADEVNEDTLISELAKNALAERWVAVTPTEPLPTDAAIRLDIGPNVPSAEGPETSADVSNYTGRTYGTFRVVEAQCGWGEDRCQPGQMFRIRMSNPIETEDFSADLVRVDPPIPGMRIGVNWNEITIQGRTAGRTTYDITIDAELDDIYGQPLGDDETRSISVDDADPALFRPGNTLVTLDPVVDDDTLNVSSINNDSLVLKAYRVDPRTDWTTFQERSWEIARNEFDNGWDVISERTIDSGGEANTFVETAIDLSAELEDGGHIVVVIGPTDRRPNDYRNEPFAVWVQNTKLGLDVVTDNDSAVAWVTDLRTGEAIDGASVTMGGGDTAQTDNDGIARLDLANRAQGVWAEHDGDITLVGDFWASRHQNDDQARWFILDDRGIYKPGETARLKGWLREADADTPANLSVPKAGSIVRWSANDGFGNQIGTGTADLSPLGGFDLEIELPEDITLGNAFVEFNTNAFSRSAFGFHQLTVQEFRRPDFEVSADIDDDGPYLAGEPFTVNAAAEYFAGGPLAGSTLDWSVTGNLASYAPPTWPEYNFGVWVPWWLSFGGGFGGGFDEEFGFGDGFDDFGGGTTESFSTSTDAAGAHALAVTVNTDGKPRPISISAAASVEDVNRQRITNSATALVHPAALYVGLRGDRTFVKAGETLSFDVIATDIDGAIQAGHDVAVTSTRIEWQFQGGSWTEVEVADESCDVTSGNEPVVCEFSPSVGGRYRIAARVTDSSDRTNLTEVTRWVAGGTQPTNRRVALEQLTLVPSGENFQPGDTAEILVQAPFADAHGLAVITRGGIDRIETFSFDADGAAVLEIPIEADDIPGIGVQIEVAGSAPRTTNGTTAQGGVARPAFAAGQISLAVPPDSRELTIEVAPRQARLEPGEDTVVDVAVTNAAGDPVAGAEFAIIVVDEAVLSLTGYQLGDPLDAFYRRSGGGASTFRGRSTLLLSDPDVNADGGDTATDSVEESMVEAEDAMSDDASDMAFDEAAAPMASAGMQARSLSSESATQPQPIELRSDFDALAVFEPEVETDADGKATIDVPLPDNLTRYRVMVVATADATDAGTGESNITARLPITVRPTPPRFANFGDVFEFPVVVQNATDDPLDVDVALRSTNLSVDGRAGTTVRVPANDRVEVRFDVSAVEAGTARFQVAASAGVFADAANGDFPVYTPATAEAFATYGVLDSGSIAQPFSEPTNVFPQFGGLEISTSSTAVAALTDAVVYLSNYRYESSDAFASRIIAIVSLDDILEAFESEQLPSPDELRTSLANDVARLANMQNDDGGFPYWRRGRESIPYNSVQAAHALILARSNDVAVDEQVMANAMFYLANIEDHFPSWYGPQTRQAISAYALHVRMLGGDRDTTKATGLFNRAGDDIQLDVAAWLWPLLADTPLDDEIELLLNNRVTETANAATFATSYAEQAYVLLHSDRRTDAIVLDALVAQRPQSDLVVKTLNGLLAARGRQGRWTNVQENSFVLLAASAYFDEFEDADPDFVARAWLGDTYALEHTYDGRTTDRNSTLVPMAELVDAGDTDIVVDKAGNDGRLYYRLGLRYAPTDLKLEPRDQGFVVQRAYEAVDDDNDVVQNNDGSWTVKAGARVRVNVTMVADSRRTHVALIDPIPAGFEIVNPALATAEPVPQQDPTEDSYRTFWWSRWFDHQNLRDDRAEAFSTWLGAGSYQYSYVARATTPGTFVTPPSRAEQIYEPEVFGRSGSTTVTVTD